MVEPATKTFSGNEAESGKQISRLPSIEAQFAQMQRKVEEGNFRLIGTRPGENQSPSDVRNFPKLLEHFDQYGNIDYYYMEGYTKVQQSLGACSNLVVLDLSGTMGPKLDKLLAFVKNLSGTLQGGAMVGLSGCESISDADLEAIRKAAPGVEISRPGKNDKGLLVLSVSDASALPKAMDKLVELKRDNESEIEGYTEANLGSTRLQETLMLLMAEYSQKYAKAAGFDQKATIAGKGWESFFNDSFVCTQPDGFPFTQCKVVEKGGEKYLALRDESGKRFGIVPITPETKNALSLANVSVFSDGTYFSPDAEKALPIPPDPSKVPSGYGERYKFEAQQEFASHQVLLKLNELTHMSVDIQILEPRKGEQYESEFMRQLHGIGTVNQVKPSEMVFTVPMAQNPEVVFPTEANYSDYRDNPAYVKAGEIRYYTMQYYKSEPEKTKMTKPKIIPVPALSASTVTQVFSVFRGGEGCLSPDKVHTGTATSSRMLYGLGTEWVSIGMRERKAEVTTLQNGDMQLELVPLSRYGDSYIIRTPLYDSASDVERLSIAVRRANKKLLGAPCNSGGATIQGVEFSGLSAEKYGNKLSGSFTLGGKEIRFESEYNAKTGMVDATIFLDDGVELRLRNNADRLIYGKGKDKEIHTYVLVPKENAEAGSQSYVDMAGIRYSWENEKAKPGKETSTDAQLYRLTYDTCMHQVMVSDVYRLDNIGVDPQKVVVPSQYAGPAQFAGDSPVSKPVIDASQPSAVVLSEQGENSVRK